jgi:hypothetical protein
MKLVCTNAFIGRNGAHWGSQFTKGKEYDFVVGPIAGLGAKQTVSLVIDSEKYHESSSFGGIGTMEINITWATAQGDDGRHNFVLESKEELMRLYGVKEVYFCFTTYLLEDYFDYKSVKRDQRLTELGI